MSNDLVKDCENCEKRKKLQAENEKLQAQNKKLRKGWLFNYLWTAFVALLGIGGIGVLFWWSMTYLTIDEPKALILVVSTLCLTSLTAIGLLNFKSKREDDR